MVLVKLEKPLPMNTWPREASSMSADASGSATKKGEPDAYLLHCQRLSLPMLALGQES